MMSLHKIFLCVVVGCAVLIMPGSVGFAQSSISGELERQSLLPRSGPADPKGIDLGSIQVRLWYEETGRLSDNIAPPAQFVTWNTIIGEGQAEEIANDVLMVVEVTSSGRAENIDIPLSLNVRNKSGERLAFREVDSILTSENGSAYKGVWIHDIGCAGELIFSAKLGGLTRSVEVNFPCGE